jgi:hypothetical protein
MAFITGFQRALAEGSPKIMITRCCRKMFRAVARFGTLVFAEVDLTQPIREVSVVPGIIPREGQVQDASLFQNPAVFLERIAQGDRCFMGIEEKTGKLTNYRWITTSPAYIPELDRYLIVQPTTVYAYDLVTLPEFRRRGIDSFMRYYTYSHLRDSGFTKIYAYIHGDNRPSLKSARQFNREIGCIRYFHIRGCHPLMIGAHRRGFPELRKGAFLPVQILRQQSAKAG